MSLKLAIVTLAGLALMAAVVLGCGTAADLGPPYSADELMAAYRDDPDGYESEWIAKRVNVTGTVKEVSRSGEVYLSTSFEDDEVILVGLSNADLDAIEEGDLAEFACVIGEYSRGAIEMTSCGPAQYGAEGAGAGSSERDGSTARDGGGDQRTIMSYWSVPLLLIAAALTVMAIARSNWSGLQPAMIALMVLGVLALLNTAASVALDYRGLNLSGLNVMAGAAFPLIVIMGWIILDPGRFYFLPPWLTGFVDEPPPPPPPPAFTEPPSATSVGGGDMGATAVGSPGGPAAAPGPGATMAMQPDVARSMAWVVVTRGPSEGQSIQLKEGNNTIGRSLDNDLQINDASVSRSHAMLSVKGEEFTLVDLGSASGTRVGTYRIAGRHVDSGSSIVVGNTQLGLMNVDVTHGTPSSGATIVGAASGHSLALIAQSGPDAGRSFPLPSAQNVIGRDPSADTKGGC